MIRVQATRCFARSLNKSDYGLRRIISFYDYLGSTVENNEFLCSGRVTTSLSGR